MVTEMASTNMQPETAKSLLAPCEMEKLIRNGKCADMLRQFLHCGKSANTIISISLQRDHSTSSFIMTSLEYAVYHCDISMVALLYLHGADPQRNCFMGKTNPNHYIDPHHLFRAGKISGFPGDLAGFTADM
jgi:hypothetical protein